MRSLILFFTMSSKITSAKELRPEEAVLLKDKQEPTHGVQMHRKRAIRLGNNVKVEKTITSKSYCVTVNNKIVTVRSIFVEKETHNVLLISAALASSIIYLWRKRRSVHLVIYKPKLA